MWVDGMGALQTNCGRPILPHKECGNNVYLWRWEGGMLKAKGILAVHMTTTGNGGTL